MAEKKATGNPGKEQGKQQSPVTHPKQAKPNAVPTAKSDDKVSGGGKEKMDKQIPNNVVSLSDHKCKFTECKAKSARAGFCNEHFEWFKAGLITKEGERAADFEKKYHNYARKKSAA